MQRQIEYNGPSFSGINPENTREVFRAIRNVDDAVAEAMAAVGEQINNVRYITSNGQSLAETVQQSRWRRGEVRFFNLSWSECQMICSEARAVFCDGRNGSPQMINDSQNSSSASRYLKAVAYGGAGGTVGGLGSHVHSASLSGAITVDNHADLSHTHQVGDLVVSSDTHLHGISITSSTPTGTTAIGCDTGYVAASTSHTHLISGNSCNASHNHTLSGTTAAGLVAAVAHSVNDTLDVSVDAGVNTPLFCALIPLMKL